MCKTDRLQIIKRSFDQLRPSAVVCFGESEWPQFRDAFGTGSTMLAVETAPHKSVSNLHAEFYETGGSIIVLTPFFARPMTNTLTDKVATRLISYGVELP